MSLRNLAYVNLMDYRYYHYKEMIKRYTDNNIGNSDSISVKYQKLQLFASACNILKELGFKTSHIQDKIKSNIYASIVLHRTN